MNAEKHECSLLKVVSDVGSTPTASTIYKPFVINTHVNTVAVLCSKLRSVVVKEVQNEHNTSTV